MSRWTILDTCVGVKFLESKVEKLSDNILAMVVSHNASEASAYEVHVAKGTLSNSVGLWSIIITTRC